MAKQKIPRFRLEKPVPWNGRKRRKKNTHRREPQIGAPEGFESAMDYRYARRTHG